MRSLSYQYKTPIGEGRLPSELKLKVKRVSYARSVYSTNLFSPNFRRELQEGVTLIDEDGKELGQSCRAAKEGIAAVTFSRIMMATPGMGK